MFDDREATRATTAKAEQEKAAKAAEALNKKLADEHGQAVNELQRRFEHDLMETVAKAQGEQEAALRQQAVSSSSYDFLYLPYLFIFLYPCAHICVYCSIHSRSKCLR